MRLSTSLLLLLLASTACFERGGVDPKDDTATPAEASVALSPELLDFGEVAVGETAVESFYVSNDGGEVLTVSGIELSDGSASFALLSESTELSLGPAESAEIVVSFEPTSSDAVTASAIVSSDDVSRPEATVTLTGSGLAPDLSFEPSNYDFGETTAGCSLSAEFLLINNDVESVEVTEVAVTGSGFSLLLEPSLPATLDAGDSMDLTVVYEPGSVGEHSGELTATFGEGEQVAAALNGAAEQPGTASETFTMGTPVVDMLFAADQSGSMDDDTRMLANAFATFASELSSVSSDWQIMVVNDDDGCNDSGILTPTTPAYADLFQSAIQSGGGWYTEALLTVASTALELCDTGECNEGFLRDDSLVQIVLLSDEPEQSSSDWSTLVEAMQASLGDWQRLRISAIAGDFPSGCGSAQPGTGYYEAAQATGGAFLSICSDWASDVSELAEASAWQWYFELADTPDPTSIEITVDGVAFVGSWEWDDSRNAVLLGSHFPDADASVQIDYGLAGACD